VHQSVAAGFGAALAGVVVATLSSALSWLLIRAPAAPALSAIVPLSKHDRSRFTLDARHPHGLTPAMTNRSSRRHRRRRPTLDRLTRLRQWIVHLATRSLDRERLARMNHAAWHDLGWRRVVAEVHKLAWER
jgi:hypothetical protein